MKTKIEKLVDDINDVANRRRSKNKERQLLSLVQDLMEEVKKDE